MSDKIHYLFRNKKSGKRIMVLWSNHVFIEREQDTFIELYVIEKFKTTYESKVTYKLKETVYNENGVLEIEIYNANAFDNLGCNVRFYDKDGKLKCHQIFDNDLPFLKYMMAGDGILELNDNLTLIGIPDNLYKVYRCFLI